MGDRRPTGKQRTLPPAVIRRIRCDTKTLVTGILGPVDHLLGPVPIAVDIKLEYLGAVRDRHRLLKRRLGNRAYDMDYPKLPGSLGGGGPTLRNEHLQRTNWSEQNRDPHVMAHESGRRIGLGYVNQHPWPKGDAVESQPVPPHSRLRLGSAHQIIPRPLPQPLARLLHDLFISHKIGSQITSPPSKLKPQIQRPEHRPGLVYQSTLYW